MKNKSYKTTIIALIGAAIIAAQPFVTGPDVVWDAKTFSQLAFAITVAVFGAYSKDYDVSGTDKK